MYANIITTSKSKETIVVKTSVTRTNIAKLSKESHEDKVSLVLWLSKN